MSEETELDWAKIAARVTRVERSLVAIKSEIAQHGAEISLDNKPAQVAFIKFMVASHFGIDPSDMDSHRRTEVIAWPRQVAMALCRDCAEMTLDAVGQMFGGRDHGTVLHAERRVAERCSTEPRTLQIVSGFKSVLTAKLAHGNGVGK